MNLCDSFSQQQRRYNGYRRSHYTPRTSSEPRAWRLLQQIYRANKRQEKTRRNKLMLALAVETGAVWYLEKVGASV